MAGSSRTRRRRQAEAGTNATGGDVTLPDVKQQRQSPNGKTLANFISMITRDETPFMSFNRKNQSDSYLPRVAD